jgi:hypothetical protein
MKKLTVFVALLALLSLGGHAFAAQCTIDAVPAATLLLPYFEVDFNDDNGVTTLFSINNASASATVAHVTLWTDESIPTLDFDIYLTGYDVQTINIRDIFRGNLPVTASAGQDPTDTISPKGPFSQDINFATCSAFPYTNPVLEDILLQHVQAAHTGELSELYGGCLGARYGDGIARGYITVDVTNACSTEFPDAPGYFSPGGGGTAGDRNILWGDYFYVDVANNYAQGEDLVHIEAFPGGFAPGDYTFYGRYLGGTGIDDREPLGTTWATRYVQAGVFDGGTDLVVWRDSLRTASPTSHSCSSYFSWVPLPQTEVVGFDEQEQATLLCLTTGPPVSPPLPGTRTCFPWETGRYSIGASSNVPSADPTNPPYDFGWLYLNLNFTYAGSPYLDQNIAQSWVVTLMKASGRFSVGMDAIPLSSACSDSNVIIGG